MHSRLTKKVIRTLWAVFAWGLVAAAQPSDFGVRLGVESQDVFLGETFTFQIVVTGEDEPKEPGLAAAVARDFTVEYTGPQSNNSTQMTIINGRVSKTVKRETILVYRLTAKRVGVLTIPRLTVRAGTNSAVTDPLAIRVREPMSIAPDALKLEMALSADSVTVGEPVTLRWTWLITTTVRSFQFDLPLFGLDAFSFPVERPDLDPRLQEHYLKIERPDGKTIIATQREVKNKGEQAIEVTFSQTLIPRRSGTFTLPASTVVCEVLAGRRQTSRSRSPFDDPFFSNLRGRDDVYQRTSTSSKELIITVKDLPSEGRPPDFAGHVGVYDIRATAEPTDVNVGDPIALTIFVSGPDYLEDVDVPPLDAQDELNRNFRISDPEPGVVENRMKVFKRILRAKHPDIERIPPIRLPYFDSRTGAYAVAETKAIPLTVKAVKVVTALDAEGNSAPVSERGKKLKAWSRGIAANYEDLSALSNQHIGLDAWLRSPVSASVIGIPPLAYALLLLLTVSVRRRRADPAAIDARRALGRARRALNAAAADGDETHEAVLAALRDYFGAKLRLAPGAVVFQDLEDPLCQSGVGPGERETLRELFEICEAGRYAGGSGSAVQGGELAARARDVVARIDRSLG